MSTLINKKSTQNLHILMVTKEALASPVFRGGRNATLKKLTPYPRWSYFTISTNHGDDVANPSDASDAIDANRLGSHDLAE